MWEADCRNLGPTAAAVFLDALENGSEGEQFGALIGLRLFGYEAWADGYGDALLYRVREPVAQVWKMIQPKIRLPP